MGQGRPGKAGGSDKFQREGNMVRSKHLWVWACVAAIGLAGASGVRGQDAKGGERGKGQPPNGAETVGNKKVYDALRVVINRGAVIYNGPEGQNRRDPAGCFRFWQGAMIGVGALVADNPELKKLTDDVITQSEQLILQA